MVSLALLIEYTRKVWLLLDTKALPVLTLPVLTHPGIIDILVLVLDWRNNQHEEIVKTADGIPPYCAIVAFYTTDYSIVLVQYTSHYRTLALNAVQDPVVDRLREREKQRERIRDREMRRERILAQHSDKQLYWLRRTASYSALLHTAPPVSAPFYVISTSALGIVGLVEEGALTLFEERYPSGTLDRMEVEERIEAEYSALVANLCAGERDRRMTLVQYDLELEL